jgi:iron only hydrogenase large subunit-like protein
MTIIDLQEKNCKNCHHCVRNCPVKAISFATGKPEIVEEECILCGNCYVICPHDAKKVNSDIDRVMSWLKSGEKVHCSLAPSFVGLLQTEERVKQTLLRMGFASVEETSIGAAEVSAHYRELCKQGNMTNILSTCCPVVVKLITTRFPQLVDQLAPVISPMRASGKMLKQKHPKDKIVFIGPCIAKVEEGEHCDEIDAVITFEDLFDFADMDKEAFFTTEFIGDISRVYPTTGGILQTVASGCGDYSLMTVDGIGPLMECLQAIVDHTIEHVFIEMSACVGSCLGGPMLKKGQQRRWKAQQILSVTNQNNGWPVYQIQSDCYTEYKENPLVQPEFSTLQIKQVLRSLGKTDIEHELNCGACGYETCKAKAVGVLQGKADPHLCLPFALEQAQSISNLIIEHTPNGIIVVDENEFIKEINPAAREYLDCVNYPVVHWPLEAILPSEEICSQLRSLQDVRYFTKEYPHLNKTFHHALIPITKQHINVVILMDLTEEKHKERKIKEYRQTIMDVTQKVIDEQMRTVQEIASLLGETTAKSKIALMQLKKTVEEESQ